jgi:hypothetical protein
MLIGICGTHGTGKSSVLHGLKELGYHIDETQLSRQAQKELGWDSLSKAQESVENMWKLQNVILSKMIERDNKYLEYPHMITFVERTPLDVLAYTYMWASRLGILLNDKNLIEYTDKCFEHAEKYKFYIEMIMSDKVPFKPEANRADLESREFVAEYIHDSLKNRKYWTIFVTGIAERVNYVDTLLKELLEGNKNG